MDMKQACLDLSSAAIALFDLLEEKGDMAPLEDIGDMLKLVALVDKTTEIREYYFRRNVQRMLALGVSPEALLRMAGDIE